MVTEKDKNNWKNCPILEFCKTFFYPRENKSIKADYSLICGRFLARLHLCKEDE